MTASRSDPLDTPTSLQRRLGTLPSDRLKTSRADAAIIVVLRFGAAGLEVLAEQRAERSGDPWSGHVGLPGGRREPRDRSLAETALRELHEEVGVDSSALDGSTRLFDVRRARPSGLRVAVFVGRVSPAPLVVRRSDPDEVATTFWLPLRALDHQESRTRSTMFGEIEVDTVVFEGHVVWGFTLRVLRDLVSWLRGSGSRSLIPTAAVRPWRSQAL